MSPSRGAERTGRPHSAIDVDVILIQASWQSLLRTIRIPRSRNLLLTERPDNAASQILQGRLAVVVDRSPSVLIAPVAFMSFFQNIDDYSTRWSIAIVYSLAADCSPFSLLSFCRHSTLPSFRIILRSFQLNYCSRLASSEDEYRFRRLWKRSLWR